MYEEMCGKIRVKTLLCAVLAQMIFNDMYLMVEFPFWCSVSYVAKKMIVKVSVYLNTLHVSGWT
jgi:hypothetical protein